MSLAWSITDLRCPLRKVFIPHQRLTDGKLNERLKNTTKMPNLVLHRVTNRVSPHRQGDTPWYRHKMEMEEEIGAVRERVKSAPLSALIPQTTGSQNKIFGAKSSVPIVEHGVVNNRLSAQTLERLSGSRPTDKNAHHGNSPGESSESEKQSQQSQMHSGRN